MLNDPDDRAAIVRRVEQLRPDAVGLWGRMAAAQMICHLNDSFLGVMGDKPAKPVRFSLWRLTKGIALSGTRPWPHGIKTRPEFEQGVGGTAPVEFEADRRTLVATIDRFTATPRGFEFRPHPMFGRMTEKEWMRWGYLHCDHHLRQFGQ